RAREVGLRSYSPGPAATIGLFGAWDPALAGLVRLKADPTLCAESLRPLRTRGSGCHLTGVAGFAPSVAAGLRWSGFSPPRPPTLHDRPGAAPGRPWRSIHPQQYCPQDAGGAYTFLIF